MAGAKVTFSAPGSGASGVFAGHGPTVAVITSSKGVAVAPSFSANEVAGGYIVTARVAGLAGMATFAMVNTARTRGQRCRSRRQLLVGHRDGPGADLWGALPVTAPCLAKALPDHVVGMAATPDGHGYWLVTKSGEVYAFGDAAQLRSQVAGTHSAAPVVGHGCYSDGHGYWLAASNGAVYAFGDAANYGSQAATRLRCSGGDRSGAGRQGLLVGEQKRRGVFFRAGDLPTGRREHLRLSGADRRHGGSSRAARVLAGSQGRRRFFLRCGHFLRLRPPG